MTHGSLGLFKLLALALVAHTFLFNFSVVRGNSMAPGIQDGDRILVDQLTYWFDGIDHGDVIVLRYPLDPSVDYIKRVVGLPGDEILMEDGRVWVNGLEIPEPYVLDADSGARVRTRVLPGHFFVLGDNRPRSSDSREFGQVSRDHVRGKVEVRVWPLARLGRI